MKKYLVATAALIVVAPSVFSFTNHFAPFSPYERVEIRNEKQNYCLDPKYSDGAKGSNVQLWNCTGELDQQWYIRPTSQYENTWFEIRNAKSNLCLDAAGEWGHKGDNIGIWTCDGRGDQIWRLDGWENGVVFININGYVLDPVGKDGGHNRNVVLWDYDYDFDYPYIPFDQHWYPKKPSNSGGSGGSNGGGSGGGDGDIIEPPCSPICR